MCLWAEERRDTIALGAPEATGESRFAGRNTQRRRRLQLVALNDEVPGPPLNELYAQTELLVLSSYREGLALALLEATSAGTPVLASDIEANRALDVHAARLPGSP